MPIILITGTTSGLGQALMLEASMAGLDVVAVNRSGPKTLSEVLNLKADVRSIEDIRNVFGQLGKLGKTPGILILNAGVNETDITDRFSHENFSQVMDTNFSGVLHWITVADELGIHGLTFCAVSSTAAFFPNRSHLGYYLSKLGITLAFLELSRRQSRHRLKVVVLGPTRTRMLSPSAGRPPWVQFALGAMAVSPARAAKAILRFSLRPRGTTLYFPWGTCLVYRLAGSLPRLVMAW